MKVNELRIGNTISFYNSVTDKSHIEIVDVYTFQSIGAEKHLVYSPISLTEEWLLNFGFDKVGIEWYGGICLEEKNNEIYYSAGEGIKLSENIKYVHQLQNLYFSLTGTELESAS